MTAVQPLPFDPIARAADLWEERIGPAGVMGAVTSVMRVQQILQSAVDTALRPHGLTFARYEALVLLFFSRRGSLPMRVMGQRLQLHPTSVTPTSWTGWRRTGSSSGSRTRLIGGPRWWRSLRPAFSVAKPRPRP